MMRVSVLLLVVGASACDPCGWPYRCSYPGREPHLGIAGAEPVERLAGYAGELWWLPAASSSWVLDGEVTLESEVVTTNASAVRVPTGPRFGYDHSVASGDYVFDVDYIDGEVPDTTTTAASLELVALAVEEDPVSGLPMVVWSLPYQQSAIIELWEGDLELSHSNAQLVIANTVGVGIGGTTTATVVSARRISLVDGVVGPISMVPVSIANATNPNGEQP